MRDDRRGGAVGEISHHLHRTVTVEGKEIRLRPVTLTDLKTTGVDLGGMALAKLRGQTMIALNQGDAPGG